MTTKLAAGYIRVSSKWQSEDDKDGPKRQRDAIERYAAKHEIEIGDRWYIDSITGTRDGLLHRRGWQAMEKMLIEKGIKLVIVENADRLARELLIQETLIEQLKEHSIAIVDSTGFDLSVLNNEPEQIYLRQILGATAQFVKNLNNQRMHSGRRRKIQLVGWAGGQRRMGDDRDKPHEKDILNRIVALDQLGCTAQMIADRLNSEGLLPRKAKQWTRMNVAWQLGKMNGTRHKQSARPQA